MLRVIGLIVIVVLAAAGGWYLRGRVAKDNVAMENAASWGVISTAGAARARQQIAALSQGSKSFVAIAPEDLASHVLMSSGSKLPPSVQDVSAMAEGDRVIVRATVKPRELDVGKILGPLAALLRDSEELRLTGTFHLVRPGLAELRIVEARLRDIVVPSPLVAPLIRQFSPGTRPEGVADNALPVPLPEHVQDIRVSEGRILVYRRNP